MKTKDKKIWIYRGLALLVVIAIAVLMFVIGRGHTIYFDNKAAEVDGKTIEAPYSIEVYVKGEKTAKLKSGERGMVDTMGQNFDMQLVVTKEKGGTSSRINVSLPIPYSMDGVILNLPVMLAGMDSEKYLSEFIPTPSTEVADEEVITDETEGLMDFQDN